MLRKISLTILLISLFLTACGDKPYGHYEDDKMIGIVENVDAEKSQLVVDISEWHKRDVRGPGIDDYGVSIPIEITDDTVIRNNDGKSITIDNLKMGQKVLVNPPHENNSHYKAKEIVLLN